MSAGLQGGTDRLQFEIDAIFDAQQRNRLQVAAGDFRERAAKLRRIENAMLEQRAAIRSALWSDYRKPAEEVDLSEIYPVLGEARYARRHLRRWLQPRRVATPLALLGSRSRIVYEPRGVVLIISPWNFPLNLTLGPLVSAVAAGNCVIIKPSERTPHASALMKSILSGIFPQDEVAVIEGDVRAAQALLRRKFDHIFFTGSARVGREVMKAAAEHLTSVTLELGGKSPVIVDRTADLDEAAKKIAWGKGFNSGQICIAPDYVLVDESVSAALTSRLREAFEAHGGKDARSGIVDAVHAARLRRMLEQAVQRGAQIVAGGMGSGETIPPTIITGVPRDAELMQEEIFGPILPVIPYRNLDEAIALLGVHQQPLVLYLFSRHRDVVDEVMRRTSAGGTAVNDTLVHFYQLNLPFGGIGESGMGRAHGFFGFEAFSHARAVLEQPSRFSGIQWMYPPYTSVKRRLIDLVLKYL